MVVGNPIQISSFYFQVSYLVRLNSSKGREPSDKRKENQMKKIALFVFNGDPMCFIHVLLNALDMKEKGYEARIVIEGAAMELELL